MIFKDSEAKALFIAKTAVAKKADDIVVMDMRDFTAITDFFVVCTVDSQRAAKAIADDIRVKLKKAGARAWHTEGYKDGLWVLIDAGDIITHIFRAEESELYDLEGLWADAPRNLVKD